MDDVDVFSAIIFFAWYVWCVSAHDYRKRHRQYFEWEYKGIIAELTTLTDKWIRHEVATEEDKKAYSKTVNKILYWNPFDIEDWHTKSEKILFYIWNVMIFIGGLYLFDLICRRIWKFLLSILDFLFGLFK